MLEDVELSPKKILWTWGAMLLEFYGRALGAYDFYIRKDNPYIWNVAVTTKADISETTNDYVIYLQAPFLQRARLWSLLPHQIRTPETNISPNASISIPNEIMPETVVLSDTQLYPAEGNTENVKIQV